jgi:hypothetical protein
MEQSASWEANRFVPSQEIPPILWNPKVHCRIYKRPPPVCIPSKLNSVHTPTSTLILSSHLHVGLPSGLFPSFSPPKPCARLSPTPYALYAPLVSFFSILSPDQYCVSSTDH